MTVGFSLQYKTNLTISPERSQRIRTLDLDEVNYSDQAAVQKARAAIVHMGIWDTFVDKVFHFGSKQRALNAIATIILGAKSDELDVGNRVRELSPEAVHDAKYELVTLLSRDGAQYFAFTSKDTETGIQLLPETGDDEVNRLLASSVFPHGLAALLREKAGVHKLAEEAWDKSVLAWRKEENSGSLVKEAMARAEAQWLLGHRDEAEAVMAEIDARLAEVREPLTQDVGAPAVLRTTNVDQQT